ncbi:MAG: acyl-CoA thioesterase [Oscillospiraceae bacterium]|nr:acyl-CoA thioesterase [Oscillospiraceae bacterium]
MRMEPYKHLVQYYETDMMGVTHHANYIHWMEEARIAFLDRLGFPYTKMEAAGVISPVVEISCRYRRPCTFGDVISIFVKVESFSGVKMTLVYDMRGRSGETVCTARSEHTFTDRSGHILRLKRVLPAFCEAIENAMRDGSAASDEKEG